MYSVGITRVYILIYTHSTWPYILTYKVQLYLVSKHTDLSKPLEVDDQHVR